MGDSPVASRCLSFRLRSAAARSNCWMGSTAGVVWHSLDGRSCIMTSKSARERKRTAEAVLTY